MGVWNTATPAGTDPISQGDDRIREMKVALEDALQGDAVEGTEAVFPGASPATAPVYRYRGLKDTTAARPAAGQYGLYFDTTRKVLQRDNGTSWDDIAAGLGLESGVKMVFYQAAAPTGWTAVAANDKFLRVVTAGTTGGTNGGSVPASTSLAHTHTVASHTHDLGNHTHSTPAHQHDLDHDSLVLDVTGLSGFVISDNSSGSVMETITTITGGGTSKRQLKNRTQSSGSGTSGAPSSNTSGAAAPATDSQLGVFAFSDVIIATKD